MSFHHFTCGRTKRRNGKRRKRERERPARAAKRESSKKKRRRARAAGRNRRWTTHTHTHARALTQSSSERDRGGPSSYCNAEVSIPLHYRTVRESSHTLRFRERAPRHGTVGTCTAVTRACPLCPLSDVTYIYYIFLRCPEPQREQQRTLAVAKRERRASRSDPSRTEGGRGHMWGGGKGGLPPLGYTKFIKP